MPIPRWQMAVWTVRVLDGQDPPAVDAYRFGDVDEDDWYAAHVERMFTLGVTRGCGDGTNFCPDRNVTRAEMAVFLTRAYDLPAGPDPGFADVPADAWYVKQVAALAASGVTKGCGDGTNFCPSRATTRAHMATFLHRAINRGPDTRQLPAGTCGGAIDDAPRELAPDAIGDYPDWSPDCSQIVFTRGGSLWLMANDGSQPRQLISHDGDWLRSPAWSPDGGRIAYSDLRIDGSVWVEHIYVVNADGTGRVQLTEGDVEDTSPSWSPGGNRMAFSRVSGSGRDDSGNLIDLDGYIATMDSAGRNQVALTRGGQWDFDPAWSPDGTQIAYLAHGVVTLMDPDGANVRAVHSGHAIGLTWSPDGTRLAFGLIDGSGEDIVIIDLAGLHEEVVTDLDGDAAAPSWSPDGQLFAFRHIDENGRRIYVTGARGRPVAAAPDCKPKGSPTRLTTAGFPLHESAAPSTGAVRLAVLFMDFPNAQAAHATHLEVADSLPYMERYLEDMSNSKLDVEFETLHRWLRAEHDYQHYLEWGRLGIGATSHAVALADDEIDFSRADAVMLVFPSDQFSVADATGNTTVDDTVLPTIRMNIIPLQNGRDITSNGWAAAHEFLHVLGLTDLYSTNVSPPRPRPRPSVSLVAVDFGIMGLGALFYIADTDPRLSTLHRRPDEYLVDYWLRYPEMLGWSRWQIGWLDADQVLCINEATATVPLVPIGGSLSGISLAVIPVTSTKAIVLENRRAVGFDPGYQFLNEGVLVYTVDAPLDHLPLKLAGDNGNGLIDDYPLLRAGESTSVWGHKIEVLSDDGAVLGIGANFRVRITRPS